MTSESPHDRPSALPLSGYVVLDLTIARAGPTAVRLLADWGANVIKIEPPVGRDGSGGSVTGVRHGPDDQNLHRNKRGVCIDLKHPDGAALFRRLVARADIVVENFRADVKVRLGIDYAQLRQINPRVILASISGFGQDGPYGDRPGVDQIVQGMSGLMSITGEPGGPPMRVGIAISDTTAGMFLGQGILLALLHRERTGEGQFLEVPMLECITSFLMVEHLYGHVFDPPTGQLGYTRVLNPYRKPFATKDGWIGLLPYTDKQWDQFFEAAGFGETIANDPRFADYFTRARHITELYQMVEQAAATKTTQEWLDLLKPLSIPVVKTNRLDELPDDPHLKAVELFQMYRHPEYGQYRQMRPPVKFAKTPSNIRLHPPKMGEHTDAVLAEVMAGEGEDA